LKEQLETATREKKLNEERTQLFILTERFASSCSRSLLDYSNMQTHAQTQATFTMPAKAHRFVASDRVEGTPVRRSDGTKIGTIERLMMDKVSGKVAYAVLGF